LFKIIRYIYNVFISIYRIATQFHTIIKKSKK